MIYAPILQGKSLAYRGINAKHLNLKLFSCTECPSSFAQKGNLQKHDEHVHQNLRPHKCSDCGKNFVERNKLKNHFDTVHLKLKPFK